MDIITITIHEIRNGASYKDEKSLAGLSDRIWRMGTLAEIETIVSPDLFILHIGINMIGNWKGEGWWGVISEQAELVPYISKTLDAFGLNDLKTAYEHILSVFPEYTIFKNDQQYCDIINFLQSPRLKITDKRLNYIPADQRKEKVKEIRRYLNELEELTAPLWGEGAKCAGWKQVFDYIEAKSG